jgi:hypothetical protein
VSARATAAAPAIRPRHTAAPARPLTVPRHRRVSGPARRPVEGRPITGRPVRARGAGELGIALGVLAALERLSRRRALGGNTWIALVAFALIGIVTLQLGLLKLNAGIGRALEHEALLQRENAALSIENSELAASDRVSSRAVSLGMETVPTGALHFLASRPRTDPAQGAAALSAPIHVSTTGSGEAPPGGPSAATSSSTSAEPSATGPATSTSTESSTAGAATTQASGASPGRASEEPAGTSRESTSSSSAPSPSTTSSPSAAAPTGAGSAEGTPAGGTRAGSSG